MNATYFEDPTDKLQYTGKEVGAIKKGDSQTTVNEKLAEEIEALKQKLSSKEPLVGASTATVMNESSFGFDKSLIDSGERINIKIEPKEDNIYVSYTFSMSDGAEKLSSNISIEGRKSNLDTILKDSSKLVSGFYLTPDNFPASLIFNLDQKKAGVLERLTAKVQLQASGDNTNYTVYKRNINTSDLKTQKDVNEFLYQEVNRLNRTSEEKKIFYKGAEKNITDVVFELINEVEVLKKEMNK